MKRVISVLLAILLIASCFVVIGFAEYKTSYDATKNMGKYVLAKEEWKNSDGSYGSHVFSYNSKGLLIKDDYKALKSYTETKSYSYDSKGNIVKNTYKNSYGVTDSEYYYYNDNGYVSKLVKKSSEGVSQTTTYKYNSDNRLIKTSIAYSGQSNKSTYTYSYNTSGTLKSRFCNNQNYYSSTDKYYYNKYNVLVKIEHYIDGQLNSSSEYEYYSNSKLKTRTEYVNKKLVRTQTYSYDSNNNLIKVICKDSKGKTDSTTTYSYDKNNNLIKKIYKDSNYSETHSYTYKKVSSSICRIGNRINVEFASTTYNGKSKKPNVTIDDSYDGTLLKGVDYSISYSNNVKPGKAKIKIVFLNTMDNDNDLFQKPITITFDIIPPKPTEVKASSVSKNSVKLSWTKASNTTGYVIYKYISSERKYIKIGVTADSSFVVKNLKSNTTYKFAVKSYKKTDSGNFYSGYTSLITVKTK